MLARPFLLTGFHQSGLNRSIGRSIIARGTGPVLTLAPRSLLYARTHEQYKAGPRGPGAEHLRTTERSMKTWHILRAPSS